MTKLIGPSLFSAVTFGRKIAHRAAVLGLTRAEAAKEIGITLGYYDAITRSKGPSAPCIECYLRVVRWFAWSQEHFDTAMREIEEARFERLPKRAPVGLRKSSPTESRTRPLGLGDIIAARAAADHGDATTT